MLMQEKFYSNFTATWIDLENLKTKTQVDTQNEINSARVPKVFDRQEYFWYDLNTT